MSLAPPQAMSLAGVSPKPPHSIMGEPNGDGA
jgi:hypothetical protein